MTQYWGGGAQDTFSYLFFIILKILGGGVHVPPPVLRGPCHPNNFCTSTITTITTIIVNTVTPLFIYLFISNI